MSVPAAVKKIIENHTSRNHERAAFVALAYAISADPESGFKIQIPRAVEDVLGQTDLFLWRDHCFVRLDFTESKRGPGKKITARKKLVKELRQRAKDGDRAAVARLKSLGRWRAVGLTSGHVTTIVAAPCFFSIWDNHFEGKEGKEPFYIEPDSMCPVHGNPQRCPLINNGGPGPKTLGGWLLVLAGEVNKELPKDMKVL